MKRFVYINVILLGLVNLGYCAAINVSIDSLRAKYKVLTVYQIGGQLSTNVQEGTRSCLFAAHCDLKEVIVEKQDNTGRLNVVVKQDKKQIFETGVLRSNTVVRFSGALVEK